LELGNIISVKLFQYAQESIKTLSDPAIKNVVVVGAGYIGIKLAES
jgi:NADPH-dependent 2,4-dienoyl-CoA reductase/sulfur reductase-like enzyme